LYGCFPKVLDDEKDLSPEEFAKHWTQRSRDMGREFDTWGVVNGQVVKTNWEHKDWTLQIVDDKVVHIPPVNAN
jgi:hypothetical protein